MHPFETKMAALLKQGVNARIEDFGSVAALVKEIEFLSRSPMLSEFVQLAVNAVRSSSPPDDCELLNFIARCVELATVDFVLMEVIDLLDSLKEPPYYFVERCFQALISHSQDQKLLGTTRAAGLDGSFRFSIGNRKLELRLLAVLLDVKVSDDVIFLEHAITVIGVAYSHLAEAELVIKLIEFRAVLGLKGLAELELGIAALADGISNQTVQGASQAFLVARSWFVSAVEEMEWNPRAERYICCLDVLIAFHSGAFAPDVDGLAKKLMEYSTESENCDAGGIPPWLGARRLEEQMWQEMARKLNVLSNYLKEESWWEPALVVETYLLQCYVASRSILKRDEIGGVESLVRPSIHASILDRSYRRDALLKWLEKNPANPLASSANHLLNAVDSLVETEVFREVGTEPLTGNVSEWSTLFGLSDAASSRAIELLRSTFTVQISNLSSTEMAVLENSSRALVNCHDYKFSQDLRDLFNATLVFTVRFLASRLNLSKCFHEGIEYLYERNDGKLPHEDKLRNDYFQFMSVNLGGSGGVTVEKHNVIGGRADVVLSLKGELLVAEIKREERDASFDSIENSYSGQASEYQSTSGRLGLLLVLDLTAKRDRGTPHLSELIKLSMIVRKGELEPRWLLIVVVPGRRVVPSQVTRDSRGRKSQKAQK